MLLMKARRKVSHVASYWGNNKYLGDIRATSRICGGEGEFGNLVCPFIVWALSRTWFISITEEFADWIVYLQLYIGSKYGKWRRQNWQSCQLEHIPCSMLRWILDEAKYRSLLQVKYEWSRYWRIVRCDKRFPRRGNFFRDTKFNFSDFEPVVRRIRFCRCPLCDSGWIPVNRIAILCSICSKWLSHLQRPRRGWNIKGICLGVCNIANFLLCSAVLGFNASIDDYVRSCSLGAPRGIPTARNG